MANLETKWRHFVSGRKESPKIPKVAPLWSVLGNKKEPEAACRLLTVFALKWAQDHSALDALMTTSRSRATQKIYDTRAITTLRRYQKESGRTWQDDPMQFS